MHATTTRLASLEVDERPCVLLATADPVEQTQLQSHLSAAGYRVIDAGDAASLVHIAERQRPPAVLISDSFSGPGNGMALCKHLKGNSATRASAVVLVCGRDLPLTPTTGTDGLPDEVLVRPLHPPEVLVRVASALRLQRYSFEAAQGSKLDVLTGTFNASYLVDRLRHEVLRAGRYGRSLALVVLDLDGFSVLNEREGAAVGDLMLREVARALSSRLRGVDLVARSGSDEFSVVLPETSLLVARPIAERLRAAVEGLSVSTASDASSSAVHTTISVGVAGLPHREIRDASDLLRCAREALARAREAGGNRSMIY
jgi:diguanylate cyclase (GGDEF)-like protein